MSKKREKRREERNGKVKVKIAVSLLNPTHARTSQADILHLDQKAVKCTTSKQVVVSFSSLKHDSEQKTTQLASKRIFRQNL